MTGVTAVMIAYENEGESLTRLHCDLVPALPHGSELVVIDNSATRSRRLREAVSSNGLYCWQHGNNLLYGPSINLAVKLATLPLLVYVCSNHGHSYDTTWLTDLLEPLAADDVVMTGSLQYSGPPSEYGFGDHLAPFHIQGGVFAARTSALLAHPYPDGRHAHWGSDICQCYRLVEAGYRLVNVPTIRSVWRDSDLGAGSWKYVHNSGVK